MCESAVSAAVSKARVNLAKAGAATAKKLAKAK